MLIPSPPFPDAVPSVSAMDVDPGDVFPPGFTDLYEVYSYRNASRILTTACQAEFAELTGILMDFHIKTGDVVKLGGNKSQIAKNLEMLLHPLEWNETRIKGDLYITKVVTYREGRIPTRGKDAGITKYRNRTREEPYALRGFIDGHKIDFIKSRVAFDLEWNSKDQTFDRDLYAARAFYECGIISVGICLTRSRDLAGLFREIQPRVKIKDFKSKFGASTTWMGKLKYRLDAGRGGGCPILALGIKRSVVSDFEDWKMTHPIIQGADFDVSDSGAETETVTYEDE